MAIPGGNSLARNFPFRSSPRRKSFERQLTVKSAVHKVGDERPDLVDSRRKSG
jgi:hypothetical protein